MRHRLAPLALLALVGCAGSPPPAPAPRTVLEPAPPPDLPIRTARACIDAASTEPFAQFIAPSAGASFRAHLARRVADLRCCFTEARRESVAGAARLQLEFSADTPDPADGASARLLEPVAPAYPVEEGCLRAIVEAWHMPHAPVSDVVRVPLDPRVSRRSSPASVRLSLPL